MIRTHAESVFSIFDEDVPDTPVFVEEPLDVPFPGVVRQVAHEHAGRVVVPGGHFTCDYEWETPYLDFLSLAGKLDATRGRRAFVQLDNSEAEKIRRS